MEDYLEQYLLKRNFRKTPEPSGGLAEEIETSSFVVHRHDARNLHYDLRIARRGSLVCWAIPKGFTYDSSIRHLAVRTEDHPIRYISFEGVIPRGEYGAGSMNIWDLGTYRLANDGNIDDAIAAGDLKLKLYGRRLRGEWHLVKLKKEIKDEWLIFKARDRYQGVSWDALFSIDLTRQPGGEAPAAMVPMKNGSVSMPFTDTEWGFEILHEGLRVMCVKVGDDVVFTMNGTVVAENDYLLGRLPFLRHIAPERAVIDGIVVSADGRGLSSKAALDKIIAERAPDAQLLFYMIDIVNFEEYDVTTMPYARRKTLVSLLPGLQPGLAAVDFLKGNGELFAGEAKKAGVAAVIAKKLDSPYVPGPSEHWKAIDLAGVPEAAGSTVSFTAGLSNPEKIFFPGLNLTKRDLFYYYGEVADLILPFIKDRPLHVLRYPDGIGGESFYQKHLRDGAPELFEFISLPDRKGEPPYFICRNRAGLLHLINLGSIDLHVWFSRKERLEFPDWIAWDLDPKGAAFGDVIKIAKGIGKILRGIGLNPFIKTSGKSGLHILAPIQPGCTYDQTRMFSESVARIVVLEFKTLATVERNVESRGGRVYIDFLQNRRGQTLAAPYAVRPVPAATVSMPLDWEELDGRLNPGMFTMQNAVERISRTGDLFNDILAAGRPLEGAIAKLDVLAKSVLSGDQ